MKVSQLQKILNLEVISVGEDTEIGGGFCGDLLSWVMANSQENDAWFTVMGNINVVGVASLTGVACVVLCHGSSINEDALKAAKEQKINILCTKSPVFETASGFYKAMGGL